MSFLLAILYKVEIQAPACKYRQHRSTLPGQFRMKNGRFAPELL